MKTSKFLVKGVMMILLVAVLTMGSSKISRAFYALCGVSDMAKAEGSVTFDAATGKLTLSGEINPDDVREYAKNAAVKTVYAKRGTILPEECTELFDHFMAKSMDLSRADTSLVLTAYSMFGYCTNLETLNINGLTFSNCTDFSFMFYKCDKLKSIDLSSLDVSKAVDLSVMFYECEALTELDLSHFNTSQVINFQAMFMNCSGLKKLDVSNFDVSKARNMADMFGSCHSLTELTLGNFDASNVSYMSSMFFRCDSLTSLDLSGFTVSKATDLQRMFYECSQLRELDLSHFDTSNVKWFKEMFYGCSSLTKLNVSSFQTPAAIDFSSMFRGCESLTRLDVTGFCAPDATSYEYMFAYCRSLTNLDVSNFITKKAVTMERMFCDCNSLTALDVSGFRTPEVSTIKFMFYECKKLKKLDLSGFDTSNVTDAMGAFYGLENVTKLDVSNFKTSKLTTMAHMFRDCRKLTTLDLSGFDTSNVTSMEHLFDGCSSLTNLNISCMDVSKVKDLSYMFDGCQSLTELNVSSMDVSQAKNLSGMFNGCSNLLMLDLSGFHLDNADNVNAMFGNCENLRWILVTEDWDLSNARNKTYVFLHCDSLVGANGSRSNSRMEDAIYARIDRDGAPGFFTDKNAMPVIARSAAASMGGTIELNFYLEIPEWILGDKAAYVTMEKGTQKAKTVIKDAPVTKVGGKTVRRFTIPVNAKEMRDEIVIRAHDGSGKLLHLRNGKGDYLTETGVTYSVEKYCEAVIASSTDAKMVKLATAMMDYGTAAQIYFGYKADGLVINDRVRQVGKQTIIDAFSPVKTGTAPSGVAGFSMALVLEGDTTVRVYVTFNEGVGSGRFAYYVDGDKKSIVKTSGGSFYLEKKNIAAKDLDEPIEFKVTGGNKSQTLKLSALSYSAILCRSGVDMKVWLGKALYLYNKAANAYFK